MKNLIQIVILATSTLVSQAAPKIDAQLEPSVIALGESARLTITLSDTDSVARPQVPAVDGLQIQSSGQSSQIRIVNGKRSASIGFTYRVTPQEVGEFKIPPIIAQVGRTEPRSLKVEDSRKALSNPLNPQGASPDDTALGDLAFLRIDRADTGEREHLYVGELTPIAIRAFFRDGTQVSQLSKPSLTSGAFTLHQLSEDPQQQTIVIDGLRYRVLTWLAGLSGVKAGEEEIEATLKATVGIPQQRKLQRRQQRSPFGGSPFDDPFFDSAFGNFFQRLEPRELSLSSDKLPLAIRALPTTDRPASFDGAVGKFKLGHFSIPTEVKTGDPVELKITVSGKGNFDRVTPPAILPAGKWKTYPAKDQTDPGDSIGFEASKTFTLPAIALEPGQFDVGFSFDYFDPESGQYQSLSTQLMPVDITGSVVDQTEPIAEGSPAFASDSLASPRANPGRIFTNPAPIHRQAWFVTLQAVPAVSLIAAAAIALIRRRRDDPHSIRRRATQKAIDEQLEELTMARQKLDAATFFACARRALQHRLGEEWNCRAEAITSEEVCTKFSRDSTIARVFSMADAVEFSGESPHPDSYQDWQDRVELAIAEIGSTKSADPSQVQRTWGEVPLNV